LDLDCRCKELQQPDVRKSRSDDGELPHTGASRWQKGLKASWRQPTLGAISRSGTIEETITSDKNLGSPGTDDPKHPLAELLYALGLPYDYR
jgi:hypothetical protein